MKPLILKCKINGKQRMDMSWLSTIKRSKLCAPSGVAAISWIKKNGPGINTGPF